jgi:hypothetical protein
MKFAPGQSGNPGGRPSIAKALEANGLTSTSLTAEVVKRLVEAMRDLDPGDRHEGASWRFAVETLLHYTHGKPKEHVQVDLPKSPVDTSKLTDAELALLEAALEKTLADDPKPTEH